MKDGKEENQNHENGTTPILTILPAQYEVSNPDGGYHFPLLKPSSEIPLHQLSSLMAHILRQ
jgi:hypothetical protein